MSFAFPALFFLLLLLPGVFFSSSYTYGLSREDGAETASMPLSRRTVFVVTAAAFLNAVWLGIAHVLSGAKGVPYTVAEGHFLALLAGPDFLSDESRDAAMKWLPGSLLPLFIYFGSQCLAAAALGYSIRCYVRAKKFDLKIPWFRFTNRWRYLLDGEDASREQSRTSNVAVYGDFIVEIGGAGHIYSGVIVDHWYSGVDVDSVVLAGATRLLLSESEKPDAIPLAVPGQDFVLRFKEVKNVNLRYLVRK